MSCHVSFLGIPNGHLAIVHVAAGEIVDAEVARRQINVLRSLLDGMPVVMRCRDGLASTVVGEGRDARYALDPQIDALPVLRLAMVPELPSVYFSRGAADLRAA